MIRTAPTSYRRDSGFSVLELLIALSIVTISAALVLPRVSTAREAMRVEVAASKLAAALVRTRADSIGRAEDRELVIDLPARTYSAHRVQTATALDRRISISVRGLIVDGGGNRVSVRFRPDGSASGGAIVLKGGGRAATITVDWLTGNVRVLRAG
jgi:general secretion pathway protein H